MKLSPFCCMIAMIALSTGGLAQSSRSSTRTDINGRRQVLQQSSSTNGTTTQRSQSINGRSVPVEQIEERVIREDSRGKVTERIVRKYGQDGRVATTDRIVIEESTRPGGAKSVNETTYRSDINGGMREIQRLRTETRVSGGRTTSEINLEQPNLNGGFRTVERRNVVVTGPEDRQQTTETVLRPDGDGRYVEQSRTVTAVTVEGEQTVTNTATYEPDANARLTLASQEVATTISRPDGSQRTETARYDAQVPGRTRSSSAAQQLKEQVVTEQVVQADGSVVETIEVRRADPNHAGRLGNAQLLSRTVCTGECLPPAPTTDQNGAAQSAAAQTAADPGDPQPDGEQGDGVKTAGNRTRTERVTPGGPAGPVPPVNPPGVVEPSDGEPPAEIPDLPEPEDTSPRPAVI